MQKKAVATGFYKRSSKLLPSKFFDNLLYSASINGYCSLNQASNEIAARFGINISKQALDNKFDSSAVDFVKSIFEDQLSCQLDGTIDPDFLSKYSRVLIKDSTRFDLPKRLQDNFEGFGGKLTSEAGASIQYEYDIKKGKIVDIDFASARRTDSQDAREKSESIQQGDLILRDMGYYCGNVIWKIIAKKAYFVSRLLPGTAVMNRNGEEICFSKIYEQMKFNQQLHQEMQVLISKKDRIPVRLIIGLVPDEVYQARIRKVSKEARKKGYAVSEEYKARAHLNLFITNLTEEEVGGKLIYQLYKIRWQIELVFKTWKSTFGVNKIHPMRYHRLMCLFYAKFIIILINYQIIKLFEVKFYKQFSRLLSRDKCFKTLSLYFNKIRSTLLKPNQKITRFLDSMHLLLSKNHWLEKRKGRTNYVDIFTLFVCISKK